jgi:hypothetical protein
MDSKKKINNCDILYEAMHDKTEHIKKILDEDIGKLVDANTGETRSNLSQYWFIDFYNKMKQGKMNDYTKRLVASNMDLNSNKNIKEEIDNFNENYKKLAEDPKIRKNISRKLFESEKASIIAIMMQGDKKLNELLEQFIVELINITKEGIEYCKMIDNDNNLVGNENNDETIVFLLNRGMPDVNNPNKSDNIHVFPGSFTILKEHLVIDGLQRLNFREKCQLMNCFWNCSIHWKKKVIDSEFFKEGNIKNKQLKYLRRNEQYPPPLNLIYEKISKNRDSNIERFTKLKLFIDRVKIFEENFANLTQTNQRNNPKGYVVPSSKYPLCFDFNLSKSKWVELVEKVEEKEEYPIVLVDDFLSNISEMNKLDLDVSLSDNEKSFMIKYEDSKPIIKNDNKSENINNGAIYWSSGFSLYQLKPESIIEFNKMVLKDAIDDEERMEDQRTGEVYKFTRSSLSGSTWKYLQLAYFSGFRNLDAIYQIAIAYMVGCYHHSWYEVTQSAIDFKKELKDDNTRIYPQDNSNPYILTVSDKEWKINTNNPLFMQKGNNISLTLKTKKAVRTEFTTAAREQVRDGNTGRDYLHFYRKYLLPLVGININKYNCNDIVNDFVANSESIIKLEDGNESPRRSSRITNKNNRGGKRNKKRTKKVKKKIKFTRRVLDRRKKIKIIKKRRTTRRKK